MLWAPQHYSTASPIQTEMSVRGRKNASAFHRGTVRGLRPSMKLADEYADCVPLAAVSTMHMCNGHVLAARVSMSLLRCAYTRAMHPPNGGHRHEGERKVTFR